MRRVLWMGGVLAVSLVVSACCKAKPEDVCERKEGIYEKNGQTPPARISCMLELEQMKDTHPDQYGCHADCSKSSESVEALRRCAADCWTKHKESAPKIESAVAKNPVDELSPSLVKSRLRSKYGSYGYELVGEETNAAGWAATVSLGGKGNPLDIYRIVLATVTSARGGDAVVRKLKSGTTGATASAMGTKKALFIACKYHRARNATGRPQPCGSYDPRIDKVRSTLLAP